ncbi:hypothetical protein COW36_03945 [bacterium (Candidatus Blackallbacteria) CG17_big_fil_post_rev_8_21_14_2_50_48_46]|uniref:DUF4878 domain-containing protein n=1 Tax=bacterium (Candidatus Blackallbacteria) CG17_big_fil_post_rev_8_21_14_2_50_48_46 TaxID=2014261 RepID=A0A2M7G8T3_9BACT|nr:MAG: hypothetical protein COW64_05000 [bacterium (Candidatus Blackallbacteria) CG18_big_fil_WC_8_21_14_2_50_49_26]PIW18451.1 MAG: hypothetical protein COW36_03945 [bacterium (Candidatus Blackallbacteria) CG17_big_fil_post_rev_8_21_14_2_50_48_46]PIW46564.1 MAG: hypothetical protein COW20_16735 [bacterium (Candidatus Blackallbacteria) CG13_big_fil_rev_8_21_14_2_50_49_14]
MRILLVLVAFLALAGGAVYFFQSSPVAKAPMGAIFNGDAQKIIQMGQKFMESIQYKDFKAAAQDSLPEQKKDLNIPVLIERLFQIKPELLDINNIAVVSHDFDSTGDRARLKMQADVKVLNTQELRKPEIILYFKKLPDGKWYMDFASSIK